MSRERDVEIKNHGKSEMSSLLAEPVQTDSSSMSKLPFCSVDCLGTARRLQG